TVEPLSSALGVEVVGLDLRSPLDDDTVDAITALLDAHLVVCFRGQTSLTPEQQVAFTKRWGAVEPHPLGSREEIHPAGVPEEVLVAQNRLVDGDSVRNDIWHTDLSCMRGRGPVAYTALLGVEVPREGWGDTLFANTRQAYRGLSEGYKALVDDLRAVHNTMHFERAGKMENFTASASSVHPLVRTHPRTGEDALYLSGNFIDRVDGMGRDESRPLVDALIAHATSPIYTYRHRWRAGDLVMWDNAATMHYAVFDYAAGMARTMHRTTVAGDAPF
ncbi:hypothetical protein AURANDRAFT_5093, partial [Aureococcus anophagefferens]